jgi:hypothetical protein
MIRETYQKEWENPEKREKRLKETENQALTQLSCYHFTLERFGNSKAENWKVIMVLGKIICTFLICAGVLQVE